MTTSTICCARPTPSMYSVKGHGGGAWQAFDPVGASRRGQDTVTARGAAARRRTARVRRPLPAGRTSRHRSRRGRRGARSMATSRARLAPARGVSRARPRRRGTSSSSTTGSCTRRAGRSRPGRQTSRAQRVSSACVNISASQLRHPGLASAVAEALQSSGLRPQDLVVELTEGSLVHDMEVAAAELQQASRAGRSHRARRLRYRLLVDEPSSVLPSRHHQDRPLVRGCDGRRRSGVRSRRRRW